MQQKECRVCGIKYDKAKSKRNYSFYCSDNCNTKAWRVRNPESYKGVIDRHRTKKWERQVKVEGECQVCGFKEALDLCHIVWRKDGGEWRKQNLALLCPNHHRLYDANKLSPEDRAKVHPIS